MHALKNDRDVAQLSAYLAVAGLCVCYEFVFGVCASQMGSFTHALHSSVECGVLACSLLAMVSSANSSPRTGSFTYSFGTQRFEVLAAFANAVFYVFAAFFLAGESLAHFFAQELHGAHTWRRELAHLTLSAVGLLVFLRPAHFVRQDPLAPSCTCTAHNELLASAVVPQCSGHQSRPGTASHSGR